METGKHTLPEKTPHLQMKHSEHILGDENGSGQSVTNPTFSEINPSTAGRLGYPGRDQWERASQTGPRPGQARLGRQGADWPGRPGWEDIPPIIAANTDQPGGQDRHPAARAS